MRWTRIHRTLLAAGLLPLLIATGCGSSSTSSNSGSSESSKSPSELLSAAEASLHSAKSVHVAGEVTSAQGSIPLEMTIVPGTGVTGTLSLKGHPIEIVEVGKDLYIKGGGALFSALGGASAASALANKWLKLPLESNLTKSFGNLTQFEQQVKQPLSKLKGGALKSTGTKTINGVEATGVESSADPSITVYIANEAPNYPVAVETEHKGKFVFSEWNKETHIAPPSGAVELSSLIPSG